MSKIRKTATLDEFDDVLKALVEDLLDDQRRKDWILGSVSAAGTKLQALNFILKRNNAREVPSLLDIGAQIGSLGIYAQLLGIHASSIDLPTSTEMFAKASLKRGIVYEPCNLSTDPLPFSDESFDYVTYLDVIEHHPHSPKRVLKEIHRVLKPGGCVIHNNSKSGVYLQALAIVDGEQHFRPARLFF